MQNRIKRLSDKLPESVGGALVISPQNRFYLTGFTSSAGYLFIRKGEGVFFTDSRYIEAAKQTIKNCDVRLLKSLKEDAVSLVDGMGTLAVEEEHTSLGTFERLSEQIKSVTLSGAAKLSTLISDMRSIKDEHELSCIRSAQSITDAAFTYILEQIAPGRTERDIALELEMFMRKNGSAGTAFETIAVSGKRSSLPHGVPSDKVLEKGDMLTLDFGARYGGYCSDMTRTVAVGEPEEQAKEVYETVLSAQLAALSVIRAGVENKQADKSARDIIDAAGYKDNFGHGLGHSLGIDVHEAPGLSGASKETLKSGQMFTVEPGIYIPERFGVRIEDMVCVTEDGAENMTKSTKQLIVL